jgi:hypothetical protein
VRVGLLYKSCMCFIVSYPISTFASRGPLRSCSFRVLRPPRASRHFGGANLSDQLRVPRMVHRQRHFMGRIAHTTVNKVLFRLLAWRCTQEEERRSLRLTDLCIHPYWCQTVSRSFCRNVAREKCRRLDQTINRGEAGFCLVYFSH